jgi:hypothetical protein
VIAQMEKSYKKGTTSSTTRTMARTFTSLSIVPLVLLFGAITSRGQKEKPESGTQRTFSSRTLTLHSLPKVIRSEFGGHFRCIDNSSPRSVRPHSAGGKFSWGM